jgi:hypothetical protein
MISTSFITDFQLNQQCSNMSKQDGLYAVSVIWLPDALEHLSVVILFKCERIPSMRGQSARRFGARAVEHCIAASLAKHSLWHARHLAMSAVHKLSSTLILPVLLHIIHQPSQESFLADCL